MKKIFVSLSLSLLALQVETHAALPQDPNGHWISPSGTLLDRDMSPFTLALYIESDKINGQAESHGPLLLQAFQTARTQAPQEHFSFCIEISQMIPAYKKATGNCLAAALGITNWSEISALICSSTYMNLTQTKAGHQTADSYLSRFFQ